MSTDAKMVISGGVFVGVFLANCKLLTSGLTSMEGMSFSSLLAGFPFQVLVQAAPGGQIDYY